MSEPRKPYLTDSEHFLLKAERYDRYLRSAVSFVLLLLVLFNIFTIWQLNQIARATQEVSRGNREYIRCILLLRYNTPPISATSTKEQTEAALDNCAMTKSDG